MNERQKDPLNMFFDWIEELPNASLKGKIVRGVVLVLFLGVLMLSLIAVCVIFLY